MFNRKHMRTSTYGQPKTGSQSIGFGRFSNRNSKQKLPPKIDPSVRWLVANPLSKYTIIFFKTAKSPINNIKLT